MAIRFFRSLFALVLIFALGPGVRATFAQNVDHRYFPETGHWVSGEFLKTYERASIPYIIYGFPITEAFQEPGSNVTVQYFQKARFVLKQNSDGTARVELTPLGRLIPKPSLPSLPPAVTSDCRYFRQTGFYVCYEFLRFFDKFGGLEQFGQPISNYGYSPANRIIQYFEQARLEWYPERQSEDQVILGNLGVEYFEAQKLNPNLLKPVLTNNAPLSILSLKVHAFVSRGVLPLTGTQRIDIIVQDQNKRPVRDTQVIVEVNIPTGESISIRPEPTNEYGITRVEFRIEAKYPCRAVVRVTAKLDDLLKETLTSFQIWW